ncbi:MAG: DinB family protein [Phycisphaerae bacterium]|nr:DinB family protein [Phycisphaerae bacterium]
MTFCLPDAIDLLQRTPRVLDALLRGVAERFAFGTYGPDTFSPYDVVGHLITGERTDWMARLRIILERGVAEPFPKYDRYAQFEASAGRSLGDLLDEFARLRAANLDTLRAATLSEADLAKRGRHPALGEVTLENLLATWVTHDLNHLAQIARAMAWQQEVEVGPWKQFLGILNLPRTAMDAEGTQRKAASAARGGHRPE